MTFHVDIVLNIQSVRENNNNKKTKTSAFISVTFYTHACKTKFCTSTPKTDGKI